MNKAQVGIASAFSLLVAISLLVPPWQRTFQEDGKTIVERAGYAPIFSPPRWQREHLRLSEDDQARLSESGRKRMEEVNQVLGRVEISGALKIDWEALRLELLAFAAAAVAAWLAAGLLTGREGASNGPRGDAA